MIRSIMVPLDGSRFGEWALPPALAIAERTGATLDLVNVHIPFTLDMPPGVTIDMASEDAAQRAAGEYLVRTSCRLAEVSGVHVRHSLRCGMVRATLVGHADATSPDLIVMTTHGRGPLQRAWLGSVADGLARHAKHPVLLIRPREESEPDLRVAEPFRHVLVPLDGSAEAEQVLGIALEIADLADAQCTAVRVVQPPFVPTLYGAMPAPPVDDHLLRELRAGADAYLTDVADRMSRPGRDVEARVLMEPLIAPAILAEAERSGADLIALATHGRGPIGRVLLGSVADKIVRGARTAVLLMRPQAT